MADEKTYEGGCHCGAIRYRVALTLDRVIACNCSICQKSGTLLAFAPGSKFELLKDGPVTDYQFGKKRLHHLFCPTCGIRSFSRGTGKGGEPTVAINVRCLDGVEPDELPVKKYDGRATPL